MLIFEFTDYRDYLNAYLAKLPKRGHGFRAKMAEFMKCEGSYVSRVLKGHSHIQLEQAEALSRLLEHSEEEIDFFQYMILLARAGTPTLKAHFKKKMDAVVDRRLKIRNRVRTQLPFSMEQQSRYFSHWHYSTVHMLLLIPELQTREALLQHLKIPAKRLHEILGFLLDAGLVEAAQGKLKVGPAVIQLPGDSPLAIQNHINWRQRAAQIIADEPDRGMHYSSVLTMSAHDAKKIREIYIQAIEKMNAIVDNSGNEVAVTFLLDYFEI